MLRAWSLGSASLVPCPTLEPPTGPTPVKGVVRGNSYKPLSLVTWTQSPHIISKATAANRTRSHASDQGLCPRKAGWSPRFKHSCEDCISRAEEARGVSVAAERGWAGLRVRSQSVPSKRAGPAGVGRLPRGHLGTCPVLRPLGWWKAVVSWR